MFCDLVGSTALSSRLDPEDLREIIAAYHRHVAKVVSQYQGFIAKYMGDGVLVYFGYPQAHEHDAERALRAGLELADTMDRMQAPPDIEPLQVRVGIATGLVVVGDLVGSGEAQERGIVGETPNLASRLQALAATGAVMVAASTRKLTGGLFEYEDLGAVELKGFAEPVQAWRVLRASGVASRFEAFHSTAALTPLVGRDEEVELLLRRWQRAKSGERPRGPAFGRAGHRQVAPDTRDPGAVERRAARASPLFLLAASPGQRALSIHQPAGTAPTTFQHRLRYSCAKAKARGHATRR